MSADAASPAVRATRRRRLGRDQGKGYGAAEWATWGFILVAVGRLSELVPGLGNLPLAKVCAVVWLVAVFRRGRAPEMPPLLSIPMVRSAFALVILMVLSVAFSIWPGGSLAFVLGTGAVASLAFALICRTVTSWNYVIGTLRCFMFTGLMLALSALLFSGGRISAGVSYDTNDLAYILVTVLPIAIGFTVINSGRKRFFYAGVAFLLLISILLTQSRGAFIALLAIAFFLIFVDVKPPAERVKLGQVISTRVVRLVVLLVMGIVTWSALPSETRERLSTLMNLSSDYNLDENQRSGRTEIWKRNLGALSGRPIGFGVDTFSAVDGTHGGQWKAPHNSLVQISVELGVLGFFLYMRIHWLAWKGLGRTAYPASDGSISVERMVLSRVLRISLVSNFIAAFFLSMAYSNMLWTFLATLVTFISFNSASSTSETPVGKRKRGSRRSRLANARSTAAIGS